MLTDSEVYNIISLPAFNKSYFARKLYGGKRSAFAYKLKWGTFDQNELSRLKEILRDLSATPI